MILYVTNIEWDLEDMETPEDFDLPTNLKIENPDEELLEDINSCADNLCDWLSDKYGFCVKGFQTDIEERNGDDTMKYYDIHMTVEGDCKPGYSVFVEASNENKAVQVMKDNHLYEEEEDLENIDYIEEITENEYNEAKGIR